MPPRQRYTEIAAHLRQQIRDGALAPGDELPSEAELCRQFDAARGTVRQAVAVLRQEGIVSSGQGRRTRVLDTVPTQPFDDNISFTQWCLASGVEPGQVTQWVTKRKADPHLALLLDQPDDALIVSVLRLRTMNSEPAMVERLNYAPEFGAHVLTFDTDSGSIYQHLRDNGVQIDSATRIIDALPANQTDADLLGVEVGTPLLRVRRRAFTPDGTPIEASDDRYLYDKASITTTSTRTSPSNTSLVTVDSVSF
ncbi:GntR family transcriptional regulator [Corynebacterium guangdongense]|uniref:GntR family transcriptional regulator n=1 Tax=Corynebacterium guangdongense TaxID=1783348 RepID=A0ABU1ZYK0_9CORY|nr:GntR family transcriptional regulator [Corynebacterium guangdongense]MDR7330001.1 GntR family transcriptional regulator [Corynebacterium guangdongense]WJZ18559.1 HTH-type transcriptional repressor YvoA [Corynebacterium guangdongense]